MSVSVLVETVNAPTISEADLAQVVVAFNEATGKLQSAHEALRAEVARLKGELHEANAQIERSGRLAALGEMAAGIAHEVRNPLGSIRLYARILEEELGDRPAERDVARKIRTSVRGLDAIVSDVLAFAKEMRLSVDATDATAMLDGALDECAAGRDGIEVRRDDRGRPPVLVECDGTLVHRALVNIIRNAIEAMEGREGAAVLVLDALVHPVREADGSSRPMAAICVRDSGPGVPADVMKKMFNPFFTTRATGTGLGLAIVHRIMDAHGGRVSVRNAGEGAGGGGAIVELLFPISADEESAHGEDCDRAPTVVPQDAGRLFTGQEAA